MLPDFIASVRLELTTSAFAGLRSIHLSYEAVSPLAESSRRSQGSKPQRQHPLERESTRRVTIPLPSRWQRDALPIELLAHVVSHKY